MASGCCPACQESSSTKVIAGSYKYYPEKRMADAHEPKSIEDYRDIVKILKSKVIKQAKLIEEQKRRLKDFQSLDDRKSPKFETLPLVDSSSGFPQMTKDFDTQNLQNKSIVMFLFKKNAEKLGLDLEGIFRYADLNSQDELDCDEFRNVLSKMSLGLTAKQISCLIYIFDEDCNGMITKHDYHNSIKAYVVSQGEQSRHYNNDCLLKIAELFADKKVDVEAFYESISKTHKQVDINAFAEEIKKRFSKRLQEREIVGAFNQIDFESLGRLERESFCYSLRAYLAKPRDRDRDRTPPPKGPTKLEPAKPDRPDPNQSRISKAKEQPSPSKTLQSFNDTNSIKQITSSLEEARQDTGSIVLKLKEEAHQSLAEVFTNILDHDFSTPVTLNVFKRLIKGEGEINSKLAIQLFRQIDKGERGSFKIPQLFEYYAQNQKDCSLLLHMMAKHLQYNQMDCSKFMYMNSLEESATVDRKQFLELFSQEMGIQERAMECLWRYFNKNGSDVVSVANIVKEVAIYEKQ